ncbi:MAG TPA: type II secretion system protein GspM [Thermodesulfobacteriota bacterium]|nr:type 4a pilus biogenesis protein PilO [Deltaproteobacteria bacterium]HNR13160.1 type II secretion system protein GspM [Thermodesulfobacteriota bacterium]HNU73157.1 type II secretion system protein GspM [Thermodesulfobacteriota bacterium]HOC38947.1 type II secretion system protein GspM [Thermodesulfobacteriota bacterium]HQO77800.1 type II secretion system protein GspM [Thermodesulfobacteriota bacterium]
MIFSKKNNVAAISSKVRQLKFRSRRERIIVLTAVLIAVVFVLFQYIIDPFMESQSRIEEEIPTKRMQLEKYRQFVAGKAKAEQDLQRIENLAKRSSNKLLSGNTSPLAAANLQEILKTLSAKNMIKIRSEKVLDSKQYDYYVQIPVQIEFMSTITDLTNFLYDIETYQKILTIVDLNIRVANRRDPRDVHATIVVAGLMQSETKSDK